MAEPIFNPATRGITRSPFTSIADLTLHQVSAGPAVMGAAAEPLVLLHALGCDLHMWDPIAGALTARHRVVRYDLRGHGLSDCGPGESTIDDHVRDLIGLLDRASIPVATLIGASVGGLIALATALRHRSRVRRLVLCGAAARIGTREGWAERIAAVRSQGLEAIADATLAQWFTPGFAAADPASFRGYRNRLVRTPAAGYIATCVALRDADFRAQAEELRVPALVISGDHDTVVPPAVAREIADTLPDGPWPLVKGGAHLVPVEHPAATAAAITRFLADTTKT